MVISPSDGGAVYVLLSHSVEKPKIHSHLKKFREIDLHDDLLGATLVSRNFCEKVVRVNF